MSTSLTLQNFFFEATDTLIMIDSQFLSLLYRMVIYLQILTHVSGGLHAFRLSGETQENVLSGRYDIL